MYSTKPAFVHLKTIYIYHDFLIQNYYYYFFNCLKSQIPSLNLQVWRPSDILGNIPSVEGKQAVNHKMNVLYCCDEPALWSQSVGTVTQHRPHGFVMLMLLYKYRGLLLKETHNSFCHRRKSSCSSLDMAPHLGTLSSFDHLHFSDKDKMKVCFISMQFFKAFHQNCILYVV